MLSVSYPKINIISSKYGWHYLGIGSVYLDSFVPLNSRASVSQSRGPRTDIAYCEPRTREENLTAPKFGAYTEPPEQGRISSGPDIPCLKQNTDRPTTNRPMHYV